MDISLTDSGYFLPVVIIGFVVVVIIAIVIYQSRSKKRLYLKVETDAFMFPHSNRPDYQSKVTPVIRPTQTKKPPARTAEMPKPEDIDLTSTRRDMTDSLVALERKYSLGNFTIATADGLVFGSSGGDTSQTDAATYSGIFKTDPLTGISGVVLFGLTHKGSDLIGIVRAKAPLSAEIVQQIAADTKDILNWWI
jgi:hypothetical protein